MEKTEKRKWHFLESSPDDLPTPGERVIMCIGYALVGEGYLNQQKEWIRYCDLGPVDKYMHDKVVAWKPMERPPKKPGKKKQEKGSVEVRAVSGATWEEILGIGNTEEPEDEENE